MCMLLVCLIAQGIPERAAEWFIESSYNSVQFLIHDLTTTLNTSHITVIVGKDDPRAGINFG